MFIKVFVPNSRGKIELTIEELEELLSNACEKAVREKCATCNRNCWGGTTPNIMYLNGQERDSNWTKVTCDSHQFSAETNTNSPLSSTANKLTGE